MQADPADRANWACVAQEVYADIPADVNNYRHLRIADFSDTVSALPPEELQVTADVVRWKPFLLLQCLD